MKELFTSATKVVLLRFSFILGVTFVAIVVANLRAEIIMTTVSSIISLFVGGLIGYFFKHNQSNPKDQSPTA